MKTAYNCGFMPSRCLLKYADVRASCGQNLITQAELDRAREYVEEKLSRNLDQERLDAAKNQLRRLLVKQARRASPAALTEHLRVA
jgi:hypothetical protein